MRTFTRTASPITLDRDGLAASQTPGAAGNLTLIGAATTLSPPRRIGIYSGGNIAARSFVVTGMDRGGQPITETVTGVNAGTVYTQNVFARVDSIAIDAAAGSALEVGWGTESITGWIFPGYSDSWTVDVGVPAGATVDYDIETTTENVLRNQRTGDRTDAVTAVNKTAAFTETRTGPVTGIRLRVKSSDQPVTLRVLTGDRR